MLVLSPPCITHDPRASLGTQDFFSFFFSPPLYIVCVDEPQIVESVERRLAFQRGAFNPQFAGAVRQTDRQSASQLDRQSDN